MQSPAMDDAGVKVHDDRLSPGRVHHLTSSPSQDSFEDRERMTPADLTVKVEQPELIIEMDVAAVEVVTASAPPRRGRGRPRINKDSPPKKLTSDADAKPRVKRPYKKRVSKATADPMPKAKRKYVRKQKNATNDKITDKIKDKEKERERKEREKEREKKEKARKASEKKERRKKEAAEKKPRLKKPRKPAAKKAKQLLQPLTPAMINARQKKLENDVLSDGSEDSVVFCQEFRPPDISRLAPVRLPFPPHRDDVFPEAMRAENNLLAVDPARIVKPRPKPSGRESPIVSRLEDSSSGNSNSSSNSDSSDSDSSDSTDEDDGNDQVLSDEERRKAIADSRLANVPMYNGIGSRLSASPDQSPSSSDTDSASSSARMEGRQKNGAYRSATPPRSPSSASSENADKSFQCQTCKKWFSSTVTLRIHKRCHMTRPGNGASGAPPTGSRSSGQRSSRRYECDCCDATFTRRERLEQHRCEMHSGALTERCEVCGRGFEDEEQQRRHTALHTPDERAGRCGECGEMVNGWEELRRHRAAHAPAAAHACPLCRKAFTYPHSLSRHLSNHSKAVYKCVVCKTTFSDADSLAKHLNSHLDRYKQLKT